MAKIQEINLIINFTNNWENRIVRASYDLYKKLEEGKIKKQTKEDKQ